MSAKRKTKTPAPRPSMNRLLEVLGERWTLRILWELRRGPLKFRELRERSDDVSPSLLNERLHKLRERGFVELDAPHGYTLTRPATELIAPLEDLDSWSRNWARREARRRRR